MNCEKTEKLILKLSFDKNDTCSDTESLELEEHLNACSSCSSKWNLDSRVVNQLNEGFFDITPSDILTKNIEMLIKKRSNKHIFKQMLLVASITFLLGIGLHIEKNHIRLPEPYEIHQTEDLHIVSNNINHLSDHLNLNISENDIASLNKANFKPHGAFQINKLFTKPIKVITFKHPENKSISLCFYPTSYSHPESKKFNVGNMLIKHVLLNNHHIAFWESQGNTTLLISDSVPAMELVDIASSLIEES